jgi:hypothetical protein
VVSIGILRLFGNGCSETSEEFSAQYEGNMNELGLTVMNAGANYPATGAPIKSTKSGCLNGFTPDVHFTRFLWP